MAAPNGSRNAAHGDSSLEQRIQVPVSPEDKARYVNYSQSRGIKLAALVRQLLEAELKKAID